MGLGFDTPSKRKNESIDKQNEVAKSSEAVKNAEQIGTLIISDEFAKFSPEQRVQILQEFAHYNSVAMKQVA